jgi:hypothetical protein
MFLRVAALLVAFVLLAGVGRVNASPGDVEQRIADFWKRVDAMRPGDYLTAADVGQWALNVIERDARVRITVADFRAATAGIQGAMDRAGPATAGTRTPPPIGPSVPPIVSGPPVCTPDSWKCYARSDMVAYYSRASKLVSQFFIPPALTGLTSVRGWLYIDTGTTTSTPCIGPAADSLSFFYCPVDEKVYVGLDQLWNLYQRFGEVGPIIALAHEYGHHFQHMVGVPVPQTATETIPHENQADCIAGAWTEYANAQKWLEYPKDLHDATGLLVFIGSLEGPTRTHGTPVERLKSFDRGFIDGLTGCSTFYPATPLLK